MSATLESRMSAMRARLSNLSNTVEQQDEVHHQHRRTLAHRYYTGTDAVNGSAVESGSTRVTAAPVPTALPSSVGLRERDINIPASSSDKLVAAPTRTSIMDPSSTSFTARNAKAVTPSVRVDTMLQLARQHAPTPTAGDAVHSHPAASRRTAAPSATSTASGTATSVSATATPTSLAMIPGGFPGLHAYSFQERFPTPRRRAEARPAHSAALLEAQEPPARTPYTGTQAQYPTAHEPQPTSQKSPRPAMTGTEDKDDDDGETSFDAFRVVQERLRQKMRQLTNQPASTSAQDSSCDVRIPRPHDAHVVQRHASSGLENTSPLPRPPPSRRAETATPNCIRSDNREDVDEESEGGDSPHDTVAPPAADVGDLSRQDSSNAESMEVEVVDHGSQHHTHRSLYGAADDTVSEMSADSEASVPPRHVPAERPVVIRASSRGAFSNPASCVPSGAPPRHGDPTHSARGYPSGYGSAAPRSRVSMRRSGCGSNGERGWQETAPSRTPHATSNAAGRRSLSSSQRNSTPSASMPRSSATREGSGSRRSAHQTTAPRPKPISLNVEATILCAVTGAELLALLRMRGLIESEGDTEEYRLPPVRCHRLYVTAEEHRQLQMLRQSLHTVAEEERRQEAPSYQRATVSARSRNAEFLPPPTVSRYMGVGEVRE